MDSTRIDFVDEENIGDERTYRYAFHVPSDAGAWQIQSHSQDGAEVGRTGEEGLFWVDGRNLILRRIDVSAIDIPKNLRLKKMRAIVDFEQMTIANRRVLLPSIATVRIALKSDLDRVSHIAFNHCRAFRAESTVSFDHAEPHWRGSENQSRHG